MKNVWSAKTDWTKLKPFIVFGTAKWESKTLDEEFKAQYVVRTSGNVWMNEKLTVIWVNEF